MEQDGTHTGYGSKMPGIADPLRVEYCLDSAEHGHPDRADLAGIALPVVGANPMVMGDCAVSSEDRLSGRRVAARCHLVGSAFVPDDQQAAAGSRADVGRLREVNGRLRLVGQALRTAAVVAGWHADKVPAGTGLSR